MNGMAWASKATLRYLSLSFFIKYFKLSLFSWRKQETHIKNHTARIQQLFGKVLVTSRSYANYLTKYIETITKICFSYHSDSFKIDPPSSSQC